MTKTSNLYIEVFVIDLVYEKKSDFDQNFHWTEHMNQPIQEWVKWTWRVFVIYTQRRICWPNFGEFEALFFVKIPNFWPCKTGLPILDRIHVILFVVIVQNCTRISKNKFWISKNRLSIMARINRIFLIIEYGLSNIAQINHIKGFFQWWSMKYWPNVCAKKYAEVVHVT